MWSFILAAAQDPAGNSGDGGTAWAQILLSIVGPAGLIGSIVALLKLKPDANSQAVTQAQGAAAEWQKIADERLRERESMSDRLEISQANVERLERELDRARRGDALA